MSLQKCERDREWAGLKGMDRDVCMAMRPPFANPPGRKALGEKPGSETDVEECDATEAK